MRQTRARISDPDYKVSEMFCFFRALRWIQLYWRIQVSLKIRVHYPLDQTIDLCRKAEAAGVTKLFYHFDSDSLWTELYLFFLVKVSHLTVHGRTPSMRCEPVDYDAIRTIVDAGEIREEKRELKGRKREGDGG